MGNPLDRDTLVAALRELPAVERAVAYAEANNQGANSQNDPKGMQPNGVTAPKQWQADGPLDPNRYVPLYVLALEGFGLTLFSRDRSIETRVQNLAAELHDQVLLDDCYTPHVPRSLAAAMIRERQQAMAEHQAREDARSAQFVAERQAELERIRSMGRPGDPSFTAYAAMIQANEEFDPFVPNTGSTFGVVR